MSTKKKRKLMDNYQCQICGDWHGKIYSNNDVRVRAEVHHVIPKSEGGKDKIENLITLCDLCHAVVTPQRWKEHFGNKGIPSNMELVKKQYEDFIKADVKERERIKTLVWKQYGIETRYRGYNV